VPLGLVRSKSGVPVASDFAGAEPPLVIDTATGLVYAITDAGEVVAVGYPSLRTLPNFVSGTGTAGADNTAQTVVSVTLPANSMIEVGDRIRVRGYWRGDTGGGITGTLAVNGVTVGTNTDGGGSTLQPQEAWLHYVDNTHANIMSTNAAGWDAAVSSVNVAGFDWDSDQSLTMAQSAVANNHIVVYFLAADLFRKPV
jgi:hypothetical protein